MSRSFAQGLGISAVALLVVLVVVDLESFAGGIGLPAEVSRVMACAIVILAVTWSTHKIVRGKPLEPSYSKEELRALMEDAARVVVREEMEKLAGKLFLRDLGNASVPIDFELDRPMPRPHIVRAREGS